MRRAGERIDRRLRPATALGLAALAAAASGCRARDAAPPAAPASTGVAAAGLAAPRAAPGTAAERAVAFYWEAHRAILAEQDFETAVTKLELAVALDADFGEAWYQLGTARLTAAASARGVDDGEALRWFRTGVGHCRIALDLMKRGSLRVWDAFELADARGELEAELATIGPASGLADDAGARAALERWAEQKGFVAEDEPADGGAPDGGGPPDGAPDGGARNEA
jgi:hypothetical protein